MLEGKPIHHCPAHEILGRGVAHSPEGRRLFAADDGGGEPAPRRLHPHRRAGILADLDRVYDLFPVLGERRRNKAGLFSGGEQQMLAIGRAMMSRPKLLMLDEPSMGLSPIMTQKIFDDGQGAAVARAPRCCWSSRTRSRRWRCRTTRTSSTWGAPRSRGTGRELLADPRVQEAYLGEGVAS